MFDQIAPDGLSRDLWSRGGTWQLQDLLASALGTLLLLGGAGRPAYFSSPWISDFALFDNRFGAFAGLFPDLPEGERVTFVEYLARLVSVGTQVRIITARTDASQRFLESPRLREVMAAPGPGGGLAARYTDDDYHEKGILAWTFYIEGSMNITHKGALMRKEKVTYHTVGASGRREKIATAYLEFDRHWGLLG